MMRAKWIVLALVATLLPTLAHAQPNPGFHVEIATRAYLDLLQGWSVRR